MSIRDLIEPSARDPDHDKDPYWTEMVSGGELQASIAISLKRIADAMQPQIVTRSVKDVNSVVELKDLP